MINWGIFGTGMIARALAVSMKDSKGSIQRAIASRSIEKADKFADKYGNQNLLLNHMGISKDHFVKKMREILTK